MTEPDPESDLDALSSLSAVRGLGEVRVPGPDAHARAAEVEESEWEGMRGPDDDPDT